MAFKSRMPVGAQSRRARVLSSTCIGVIAAFSLGGNVLSVRAASTATLWLQTMDSCRQSLGQSQYDIINTSGSFHTVATTPSAPLHSVGSGSGCPSPRGDCVTTTDGCVQVTGVPTNDKFTITEIALPPANSGDPLGYAPCNGGSACRDQSGAVTISSGGTISVQVTNVEPDNVSIVYPSSSSSYAGTASDPIVFHDFGLGSGSCDGDTDADDHLTGGVGSHCPYQPESGEATACQPYPWTCTLPSTVAHFVLGNPGTVTAGSAFNETISAVDSHGNVTTSYSGGKTLTWSGPSSSPGGTAPKFPTNPVTFTSGVAHVSITLYDAQVTAINVSQSSMSGSVNNVNVAGAAAKSLSLSAPGAQTAGKSFNEVIKAVDAYGNAAGYTGSKTLSWSGPSSSPNGTAPGYPSNPVTFSAGAATVAITLYDVQSTTLGVSDGTLSAATSSFAVATPGASFFALSTPPSLAAGHAFSETLTAIDKYGNTVTSVTGSQSVTWSGPNNSPNGTAPSYPSSVTFSSGVGTASVTLVDAQTTTLSAKTSTLAGTSASFSVLTAPVSSLGLSTATTRTAGTAFTQGLTALDAYGNGFTGALCITFSGPASSPNGTAAAYPAPGASCSSGQSSVSFAAGQASLPITLYDAQSTSLTAAKGSLSATTATFTVAMAAVSQLTESNPSSSTAGAPFNETLGAFDPYGNGLSAVRCVAFSGPAASPNNTAPAYPPIGTCPAGRSYITFNNGVATASITLYDAQNGISLTATNGTLSASTSAFNVAAAAMTVLTLPTPATQTAGSPFAESVTLADAYGNGFSGSRCVSFSGPAASPGGFAPSYPAAGSCSSGQSSLSFTNGSASASITLYDAQSTGLSATSQSTTGSTPASFTVQQALTHLTATTPAPTAGTSFAESLTAKDPYGNSTSGPVCLTFSGPSSSPSGTAPAYPAAGSCGAGQSAVTFTNGAASAAITLFDAQSTSLSVSAGTYSATTAPFSVSPAAAGTFSVGTPSGQTAGTGFTETISAVDAWGNTATGYARSVTVSGPASSPNGNAPQYGTISFSSGVASFGVTLYDAQTTSLTVSDGHISGSSSAFVVGPAAASAFTVPKPGAPSAGTAFSETITAVDTYGNTATTFSAATTVSGPHASPNGTAPSFGTVTFASGVATVSITLFDAETTALTASGGSIAGSSGTFSVSAGAAKAFGAPTPAAQTAGTSFSETFTVTDTWGNAVTGYSGSPNVSGLSPSPNGTAAAYSPNPVTFSNGSATVTITGYDAQTATLSISDGTINGASGSFSVAPAGAANFSVTAPGSATAGAQFTVTVKALDAYANAAAYSGSKTLSWSGPSSAPKGTAPVYPTNPVTFTNGTASGKVTLYDVQSTSLSVTDGVTNGSTGMVVVASAAAQSFSVSMSTSTPVAGTAFTEQLTAVDKYGNAAVSYSGSQTVTWTGSANAPNGTAPAYPASVSFSGGVGTASITLYNAQPAVLVATAGTVSGSTARFSVLPAVVSVLSVTAPSQNTAGVAFNAQVVAKDAYGNAFGGTMCVAFSGPSSSPSGAQPVYPAAGPCSSGQSSLTFSLGKATAAVTLYDAQSTMLTGTSGALSGTSPAFTVLRAGLAAVSVSLPATITAGAHVKPTIAATDAYGNNFTGAQCVTFSGPASSPNGTAPAYPAQSTCAAGQSLITFYSAGAQPTITLYDAQNTSLAVAVGALTGTSGALTIAPAGVSAFALSNPGAQTAGSGFTETIAAVDSWGNTVTGYSGAAHLSGPHSSPSGKAPTYGTIAFSGGVASVSVTLYDAESISLSAAAPSGASTISGTSALITVGPAAASTFSVPTPAGQTAGSGFSETVTALDAYGNTATGYSGTPTVAGLSASPNGTAPQYSANPLSFSNGSATVSITAFDAQSTSLTVSDGTASGSSQPFTVAPAMLSAVTPATPGGVTAGAAFNEALSAVDAYGNAISGTVCVTFGGPGTSPNNTAPAYPAPGTCSSGASSVVFTSGAGAASITLYDAQNTALAAAVGTGTAQSGTFAVSPGTAASLAASNPGAQTAGTGFTETLTADDTWGNVATGYAGSPALSGPDPSPSGTHPAYGTVSFSGGVASVGVTLYDAETTALSASDGTINGSSGTFAVGPGGAASFTVPTPAGQTAGGGFSETVTVFDAFGNTATGYAGAPTVAGLSTAPNGTAPQYSANPLSFSNGSATVNITPFDAQSTSLTVSDGTVSGSSQPFTVSPATTVSFVLGNPGTQTAGANFTVAITAEDAYGNTATGYNGAPSFSSAGNPDPSPNGTAPSYSGTTFTSGTASVSVTLVDAENTHLKPVDGAISGDSGQFTVNPGTTAGLTVGLPTSSLAGSPDTATATAVDAWGNQNTADGSNLVVTNSDAFSAPGSDYPVAITLSGGQTTFSVTFQPDPTQPSGSSVTQTVTVGPDGSNTGSNSTAVQQ